MRARELWLWLGGAFLTIGTVLSGIALAYFTRDPRFELYLSWQFLAASASFLSAFACFLGGILGWRFQLRRSHFPNIRVEVGTTAVHDTKWEGDQGEVEPLRFLTFNVHFINYEAEQAVSIKMAWLCSPFDGAFAVPSAHSRVIAELAEVLGVGAPKPADFPVNLQPRASYGADLIYMISKPKGLAKTALDDLWLALEEANTDKIVNFPAQCGDYYDNHGFLAARRIGYEGRRAFNRLFSAISEYRS